MRELGIISGDFPSITAAGTSESPTRASGEGSPARVGQNESCPGGCKPRAPPPAIPDRLPFEPVEENTAKMKAWLLDRYAASTFNKCGHQHLPMMSCEPLRIHIDPEAKPVAAHNARPVPI